MSAIRFTAHGQGSNRFVVLAAPRTGSNWLCSRLNSHPDILCHHEVFNPGGIHYALDHREDLEIGSVDERDRSPLQFLARLWDHSFEKRSIGFKLNRGQNEAVFHSVLGDPQICKIVVIRRNRIKTFVSELIAVTDGRWESYGAKNQLREPIKVKVEVEALMAHIALNENYYGSITGSLKASNQQYHEIAYEDMQNDAKMAALLRFLNVRPADEALVGATTKQNSTCLRDTVSNFEALDDALRGTDLHTELLATGI